MLLELDQRKRYGEGEAGEVENNERNDAVGSFGLDVLSVGLLVVDAEEEASPEIKYVEEEVPHEKGVNERTIMDV
jgi:hypothetical protein